MPLSHGNAHKVKNPVDKEQLVPVNSLNMPVIYYKYEEDRMTQAILFIGVAAFIVYAAFSISYYIDLRRTSNALREFLMNTEGNLNAALIELKGTLENMNKITENVSGITKDVRDITDTVVSVEKGIQNFYGKVKNELASAAEANVAGLKAGIATGVVTLVRNMRERRSDDHEGGP
jgi:hypothetical protein